MVGHSEASQTPNQDERVMAALAHGTAILMFLGVIGPIVIWVTQKDKSEYVRFQALQAIVHQVLMVICWFLGMACYICSLFVLIGLTIPASTLEDADRAVAGVMGVGFFFPMLVFIFFIILQVVYSLYGLYGAVGTLRGRDFHYLIIGQQVKHYLEAK